ncbi:MAG: hypothetical protein WBA31_06360 [Candidatus Dormiibacterota bacterium]
MGLANFPTVGPLGPDKLQVITINGAGNTLYLSDKHDPHAYQVAITDSDTVPGPETTSSGDLTGSDSEGEAYQIGIGLSPDGSDV